MKLLRLANTINSTSAPYNQFSLGFKETIDQTFCSLFQHDVLVDKDIRGFHGDGSILKMLKLVKELVNKNKYDVVHIHSGLTGLIFIISIFPFRLALLKRTVFTLHTSYNLLRFRNKILVTLTMFIVSKVCPCSKSSLDSIPKPIQGYIQEKTFMIVNGFNHHRIDIIKNGNRSNQLFSKDCGLKLVCVGALNDNKNQFSLLKAVDNLEISGELVFLGDGPKKQALELLANNLSTKINVVFKGQLSRDLAIEHMLEADIFVSLSKGEGMPISVLEAMYSECFLILSNISSHKEISPPTGTCIFVDSDHNNEIVDAINLSQKNTRGLRANALLASKYVLKNYSVTAMLNSYYQIYQMLSDQDNTTLSFPN